MMQSNDCAICLEPLINSEQDVGTFVPCGHCFHEDCFEEWKSSQKETHFCRNVVPCPMCNVETESFVKIFIKSTREEEVDEKNSIAIPPEDDEALSSLSSLFLQYFEELSNDSEKEGHSLTALEQSDPVSAVCHHVTSSEHGETPLVVAVASKKDEPASKEGVNRGERKRRRSSTSSLVMGRDLQWYKQKYKEIYLEFHAEKQAWSEQEKALSEKTQDLTKNLKLTSEGLQQYKQMTQKWHKQIGALQKDMDAIKAMDEVKQRKIDGMEAFNRKLKDTVQLQFARIQELLQSKDGNHSSCTAAARRDVDLSFGQ